MTAETTIEDKVLSDFKQKILMRLGDSAASFFEADNKIMNAVQEIFETIGRGLKANERELFTNAPGTKIDIDALRAAFKGAAEDGGHGDVAGGDIIGGDIGWLTDLGHFIHDVGDFIKYEKKTFLAILLLIFCKDCHCVCEFINKPE